MRDHLGKVSKETHACQGFEVAMAEIESPVEAGGSCEQELTLEIPTEEKENYHTDDKVPEDMKTALKSFSTTVKTNLINVRYYVRVNVAHDTWEVMDGAHTDFPIQIMQAPVMVNTQPYVPAEAWDPVT